MNRRRHRPAIIVFVVIVAAACLALAWWQLDRFESSAGSARNLGYALQWPLFAVAALWGYKRFVQLEDEAELQEQLSAEESQEAPASDASPSGTAARSAAPRREAATLTAIPEGFLPSRPPASTAAGHTEGPRDTDAAHDEYNRLLAELAASDAPVIEEHTT